MKKALSLVLSLIFVLSVLAPFSAYASSYEQKLRDKGFTEGYIAPLAALHKKYPNWNFEAFKTNLNWKEAVNGERSVH